MDTFGRQDKIQEEFKEVLEKRVGRHPFLPPIRG